MQWKKESEEGLLLVSPPTALKNKKKTDTYLYKVHPYVIPAIKIKILERWLVYLLLVQLCTVISFN